MSAAPSRRQTVLGLGALLFGGCAEQRPHGIKVALAGSLNTQLNGVAVWVEAFARILEAGGLSVEVFANGALGSEEDRTELTSLGLLPINDAGYTEVEAYAPIYRALILPFLLDSHAHFDRALRVPRFRADLASALERIGLRFMDTAYLGGMSGLFTTGHPVRVPSDLEGLRLRAMGNLDLTMIEALGASGVQVAWEEVPQALQTGIADGYFNPPLAPVLFGHGSQINYFTALRSSVSHRPILCSARWLDNLSTEHHEIVRRALDEAHNANRAWARLGETREREALEAIGVTIIHPGKDEREAFAARVRSAYPQMVGPDVQRRALELARTASGGAI